MRIAFRPSPCPGVPPVIARRLDMPEIMVFAAEGRTVEQKRGLVKDLTEAMVKNFGVPAEVVTVQIVEAPKTDKAKGGVLFCDR
ncbi:tautomerase family protein [Roseomonas gilardii]